MKDQNVARPLHLYDSFKGLPAPSEHDTYFKQGELLASLNMLLHSSRILV